MINSREELRGAQCQIEELQEILDEMRQEEAPQSYALLCKSYVQPLDRFNKRLMSIWELGRSSRIK